MKTFIALAIFLSCSSLPAARALTQLVPGDVAVFFDQINENFNLLCSLTNVASQVQTATVTAEYTAGMGVVSASGATGPSMALGIIVPAPLGTSGQFQLAGNETVRFGWNGGCTSADHSHDGQLCGTFGTAPTSRAPHRIRIDIAEDRGAVSGGCQEIYYPPGEPPRIGFNVLFNGGRPF